MYDSYVNYRVDPRSAENPDGPIETVAVIGRVTDTAGSRNTTVAEVIENNLCGGDNWSLENNLAWIESIVQRGLPVRVVSPITVDNFVNTKYSDLTVFVKEIGILIAQGYRPRGDLWINTGGE